LVSKRKLRIGSRVLVPQRRFDALAGVVVGIWEGPPTFLKVALDPFEDDIVDEDYQARIINVRPEDIAS
jgi:hypothetical protein